MDDPFIYTSGFNEDRYDARRDLFAEEDDDDYNPRVDLFPSSYPISHEDFKSSMIIRKPRPGRLDLPTMAPASNTPSPATSDSGSSCGLSTPPSFIAEDCPCQCGGFRGSCYLLTLPPSPLHFLIKGCGEVQDQHLFVSDQTQFLDKQRSDLETMMKDLNDQLERWRKTRIPPRCLRPWLEPETSPIHHDDNKVGSMYVKDLLGDSGRASISIPLPETVNNAAIPKALFSHEQLLASYIVLYGQKPQIQPTEADRIQATLTSHDAVAYPTPEPSSTTTPSRQHRIHISAQARASRKRSREDDREGTHEEIMGSRFKRRR